MKLKEMKKDELVELVGDMECVLMWLEIRLSKSKVIKKGRREEVMEVLIREKRISVGNIGKTLGMSCRNVSSYLCYLRKEGVNIGTDSKGRKFIEKDEEIEEDSTDEGGLVTEGENVDEVVEEIVNDIQ